MGLFSKSTYKDYYLDFKSGQQEFDDEAGMINIEAHGNINGEELYFFSTYLLKKVAYKDGTYEKILEVLSDFKNKKVKVTLKFKDQKIKDFKIDLNDLSQLYHCTELKDLELAGYGLNKESNLD